jgi:hypothetical protein
MARHKANLAKECVFSYAPFTVGHLHLMTERKGMPITRGLAKYGLTEAVFQLLFFNLAAYPARRYKFG